MDKDELFNTNIEMAIRHLAYQFPKFANDEDARQESLIALWKATETYTDNGSAKFQSYAQKCITNHILNWIKSTTPTINVKTQNKEKPYKKAPVKFKSLQEKTIDGETEFQDTLQDDTFFEDDVLFEYDLNNTLSKMSNDNDRKIAVMLANGMSKQEIIDATGLERHIVDYSCKRIGALLSEQRCDL